MNLKKAIKKLINTPRSLYLGSLEKERIEKSRGKRKIFYLMGLNETHRNLGDQAQGVAIREWFKNYFPEYEVFEYRCYEKFNYLPLLLAEVTKDDLIFLHSGGNFGDTWPHTEEIRQDIIERTPHIPIVQLPQTIDFSDSDLGRRLLENSKRVIGKHERMIIMGRDLTSTELAQGYFPGKVVRSFPDMVLSLAEHYRPRFPRPPVGQRQRLLMIMRNDKEGIFSGTDIASIKSLFPDRETVVWDTDVDETFPRPEAKSIIEKHLDFIATFDHIITDRYHGLIFSVIVNRPCVVLPTVNHKITSAAGWFSSLPTVRFAKEITEVPDDLLKVVNSASAHHHDWDAVHFRPMAELVRSVFIK